MVTVEAVSKSYKSIQALRNVSFDVPQGELFGLIGPDGSGKSTLFRILTTLLYPDEGRATVMGFDTVKDFKELKDSKVYKVSKEYKESKERLVQPEFQEKRQIQELPVRPEQQE